MNYVSPNKLARWLRLAGRFFREREDFVNYCYLMAALFLSLFGPAVAIGGW